MNAVALELHEVTLRLGSGETAVTALDAVSLSVRGGELVAVVGPSGSGKSSLLAVAGGLLRPTAGAVRVDGQDLTTLGDRDRTRLRRAQVGYVFQSGNLLPSLTAVEQLLLVRRLSGRIAARDRDRARELLDAVGMAPRADRRPHQLSGGERQRVGIARALMAGAPLLLVDEPTSALDHQRAEEIVALLAARTHAAGAACVMVTHDARVLDHADRVLHLRDGSLGAG